jgi:hypothetical protein
MCGGSGLFVIQLGEEIAGRIWDDAFARRIEPKVLGHGAI